MREGSVEAPTRHPIEWKTEAFWDRDALNDVLALVYDVCHGCRRCVSLCDSLPTLFDLIDESETFEVDGVALDDYHKVVDQCYMCDLCYLTKCPYVPPHECNVDFPHLMLRAKAQNFKDKGATLRDKVLTSTDALMSTIATIPLVDVTANALNKNATFRKALESSFDIAAEAPLPEIHRNTLIKRAKKLVTEIEAAPVGATTGKLALYATCYGHYSSPTIGEDFITVYQHNDVSIDVIPKEKCCGLPKLELGDLDAVEALKEANIPLLAGLVDQGYDLTAPIPSCVLMYKQEHPLLFPDDPAVLKVKNDFYSPFESL